MKQDQVNQAPTNEEVISLLKKKLKSITPDSPLNFGNHTTFQTNERVIFTSKNKKEQGVIKLISLKKEDDFKVCFEFFRKMYEEYANTFGEKRVKYKRFWFLTKDEDKPYFKIHFYKEGKPIEENVKKIEEDNKRIQVQLDKGRKAWREAKKYWKKNEQGERDRIEKEKEELFKTILKLKKSLYKDDELRELFEGATKLIVDVSKVEDNSFKLSYGVIDEILRMIRVDDDNNAKQEFRNNISKIIKECNDFNNKKKMYAKRFKVPKLRGRPLRTRQKDVFKFEFWPSKCVKIVGFVQKSLRGAGINLEDKNTEVHFLPSPDK